MTLSAFPFPNQRFFLCMLVLCTFFFNAGPLYSRRFRLVLSPSRETLVLHVILLLTLLGTLILRRPLFLPFPPPPEARARFYRLCLGRFPCQSSRPLSIRETLKQKFRPFFENDLLLWSRLPPSPFPDVDSVVSLGNMLGPSCYSIVLPSIVPPVPLSASTRHAVSNKLRVPSKLISVFATAGLLASLFQIESEGRVPFSCHGRLSLDAIFCLVS